jgi:hypothetical protein
MTWSNHGLFIQDENTPNNECLSGFQGDSLFILRVGALISLGKFDQKPLPLYLNSKGRLIGIKIARFGHP